MKNIAHIVHPTYGLLKKLSVRVGNRELLTGNSFRYLDILNFLFLDPTKKNVTFFRHHRSKPGTFLFEKSAKPLLINGFSSLQPALLRFLCLSK